MESEFVTNDQFENLRNHLAIRKLSCYECFVLMGMKREDVDKAKAMGISNSQLYKIAGRQA